MLWCGSLSMSSRYVLGTRLGPHGVTCDCCYGADRVLAPAAVRACFLRAVARLRLLVAALLMLAACLSTAAVS